MQGKRMKRLAVGWVLLAVAAPGFGSTLTATGSNSLWNIDDPSCSESSSDNCVIGDPTVFGIESASLTVNNSGDVSANILTNFGDSTLAPFTSDGLTFSAADMLISTGGAEFALVLDAHSGMVTGGLYSIVSTETAQTVLGNPSGIVYRNDLPVWASPAGAILLGTGTVVITSFGDGTTSPEYDIAVSGITGGTALFTSGAFTFEAASSTCGNGVLYASTVPETGTMAMIGMGLLGLALLSRRRKNRG
jgi:uncharacterized protein (TIGR03382 family)